MHNTEPNDPSPFEDLLAIKLASKHRDDVFAVVHQSSYIDEGWRISYFDNLGAVGHAARATIHDLLKEARSDGYSAIVEVRTRNPDHAQAALSTANAILNAPRPALFDFDFENEPTAEHERALA